MSIANRTDIRATHVLSVTGKMKSHDMGDGVHCVRVRLFQGPIFLSLWELQKLFVLDAGNEWRSYRLHMRLIIGPDNAQMSYK